MIKRLKRAIRKWLGLGDMFVGVDLGIKDESCVVVVSRLKDGRVKIMDVRFGNLRELHAFLRQTQHRYGIPNRDIIVDKPLSVDFRL